MKQLASFVSLLILAAAIYPQRNDPAADTLIQEIVGVWTGGVVYIEEDTWFPLGLNVWQDAEYLRATLDAPQQGELGLPVEKVNLRGAGLVVERITASSDRVELRGDPKDGIITGAYFRNGKRQGIFQMARRATRVGDERKQQRCARQDRDHWQKMPEIMGAMEMRPGAAVAEVGAGDGWVVSRLARATGDRGTVYAVDISEDALRQLRSRVEREDLRQVEVIQGEGDDPKLPDNTLDAVVMVNAYHEMTGHAAMLARILRALKPEGRLVIVDNISERRRTQDRDRQTESHELGINFARAELQVAGFEILHEEDPFLDRPTGIGDAQWILVGRRPK